MTDRDLIICLAALNDRLFSLAESLARECLELRLDAARRGQDG